MFLLLGAVGLIWAVAWYRWFRDEPRDHAGVSPSERDLIERERALPAAHDHAPWRQVFRTRSLFPLCLQYLANTYGFYFFITWLPTYLAKARGLAAAELAFFAGFPLLLSVIADITGGMATDALSARFGTRIGRCGLGTVAYFLASLVLIGGTLCRGGRTAGTLIAVAGALSMFTLAPSWATAIGLGGRNAALVSATMNTAGQIGGILSPIVLAYIVDLFGDWSLPLHILSGLYLLASISWLFIHPERPAKSIH